MAFNDQSRNSLPSLPPGWRSRAYALGDTQTMQGWVNDPFETSSVSILVVF